MIYDVANSPAHSAPTDFMELHRGGRGAVVGKKGLSFGNPNLPKNNIDTQTLLLASARAGNGLL